MTAIQRFDWSIGWVADRDNQGERTPVLNFHWLVLLGMWAGLRVRGFSRVNPLTLVLTFTACVPCWGVPEGATDTPFVESPWG